jgi:hypothetical protein
LPSQRKSKDVADPTRTIAHLHLFSTAATTGDKSSPVRPTTGSIGLGGKKSRPGTSPGLGMMVESEKVEADRKLIGEDTTAGIWDGSEDEARDGKEGKEKDLAGRKWVLRIGFGTEGEWFCDMPSS